MVQKVGNASRELALQLYTDRLNGKTWADIRAEYGLFMNTAKAIMDRFGLKHSPNGVNRKLAEKWDRPCTNCGKRELRSKGLFRCKWCRKAGNDIYNAQDSMYHGGA